METFPVAGKTANSFVVVTFKYLQLDVKYEGGQEKMQQTSVLYKTLVIGVIILFVGASITPSICGYDNKLNVQSLCEVPISSPLNDSLLGYWAFDECSGSTAGDSSGHGYDGTVNGATWTTDGYSGCALVFDGSDDYVNLDAHAQKLGLNKTDDYIIEAYFKSTSSSTGSIYSMSHTNVARAFAYLNLNADGTISYKTGDETCLFELYTPDSYNDGSWHKVEIKFYGDTVNPTLEIYIDGDLKAETTEWLCPYLAEDFITAKIGRKSNAETDYFAGEIDDVKIYKNTELQPPPGLTITGPDTGKPGQELTYIFRIIDPYEGDLIIIIDWDDGNTEGAIPGPNGTVAVSHVWYVQGTISIRAYTVNEYQMYGPPASKQVLITRGKSTNNVLFWKLLERFPLLEVFLRIMNLLR